MSPSNDTDQQILDLKKRYEWLMFFYRSTLSTLGMFTASSITLLTLTQTSTTFIAASAQSFLTGITADPAVKAFFVLSMVLLTLMIASLSALAGYFQSCYRPLRGKNSKTIAQDTYLAHLGSPFKERKKKAETASITELQVEVGFRHFNNNMNSREPPRKQ